ncbi:LysR family transcriptional regulator [Anaerovorax odorimutans]|uniref:LysR family transcriptional regulator n=1 Tax=Anaerovorax odorimutans TaxID=109327 RepID=UPI0003FC28E8|nr:LysR family transcriptional regulator [Anaerovorax odorimutans]
MDKNIKYRVMLFAADCGSFSKAAKLTGYTPSGITHMMNSLEEELGFNVFLRDRRGIKLTEDGEHILPIIREIVHWEEQLLQTVSQINGLEIGCITIGSYSSIASHWLPQIIKRFKQSYPNIEIRLMEGIRQEVESWLSDKRVDLAFYTYQQPMKHEWIPLCDDPMLAVIPSDHPLAKELIYPLANCQYEDFIMPAMGQDDDVVKLLKHNNLSPHIAYSTLENYAAISMIEQGLGMSIMNELITKNWKSSTVMLPLDPPQYIRLGIGLPSIKSASPATKKFIEYTKEILPDIVSKEL